MVVNKRKKNSRQRAGTTHGFGSMKKNRGAGNRGGRGRAGTGKRCDTNKPSIWKNKKYFGKSGFKRVNKKIIKAVNMRHIEEKIDALVEKKLVEKDGEFYVVNLSKLGFNKLLSEGKILNKYKIEAEYASKNVIERIKKNGGEITVLSNNEDKDLKQE